MDSLLFSGLINGIILGTIYGLIGISLNIIYGVLRIVNFAHGEFLIIGAYCAWLLARHLGLDPFSALLINLVVFFFVGYLLYFILVRRLSRSDDPETSSLLLMFGLSMVLSAGMLLLFNADSRSLDFQFDPMFLRLDGMIIPSTRLVALALSVVLALATGYFLYYTQAGKAMRAIVMNRDATIIVGINVERLSAIAFALGISLATATGVIVALVFPSFSPFMGKDYTLIGFVIIVLGGLGNPVGALLGALIYGITEQVTVVYFNPSIATILGFLLMIIVIYFKPTGLLGRLPSQ